MKIVLRILWLIIISGLGGLFYAVAANILVATGTLDPANVATAFGQDMTAKAAVVWMISIVIAAASLAMSSKWRYALLLAPLYAPAIFAVLFVLMNRGGIESVAG
jgi:hypothetical protein